MTGSQRLAIQISETRQALSAAITERNGLANDAEPSAELVSKLDKLSKDLQRLEVEYRAALVSEESENRNAQGSENEQDRDAEAKERDAILAESSLLPFVYEAIEDRAIDGREAECRAALLGDDAGRLVPVDLLLPPGLDTDLEHRADVVTPVDASLGPRNQADVLPRVFTRSVAARLGVSMPSVPVGQQVYPIMASGTGASNAADAAQVDATAGSFTGHTLEPVRLTGAYLFNARQTLQLRNFEAVLRRDLSAVMSDEMDRQIIQGDGQGAHVTGFLNELPAPADTAGVTTWEQWLNIFSGLVDGLNAFMLSDLRAIVGAEQFQYLVSLFRTGATDNGPRESAWDYVGMKIGGASVSSRILAAAGDKKKQVGIAARTSYPGRNAVAPIWRGMELIRDPYTNAGKGQVRLTAIMFWSFKILREAGWSLFRTQHKA